MTADEQAPLHHEIILYATPDGTVRVEVVFEDETFWLTQRRMADLFGVGVPTISHHLKQIYKSHELNEMATVRKIRTVQTEGGREVGRDLDFFNLDVIQISCVEITVPFGADLAIVFAKAATCRANEIPAMRLRHRQRTRDS